MTFPNNVIPTNNPLDTVNSSPVSIQRANRDPKASDNTFPPGTEWQNTVSTNFFKCSATSYSGATWVPFVPANTGNVSTLTANSGGAVGPDGFNNINVVGDGVSINIAGNPGTNTLTASLIGGGMGAQSFTSNVAGPVTPNGSGAILVNASTSTYTDGTVANTLKTELQGTNHAVFIGRGSHNPATTLPLATNGQVLIGSTGADPVWAGLTAGANITITPGAGSITIASTGGAGTLSTLTGNSGGAVSPTAGNINIVGDGSTISIAGNPGTSTLTASFIGAAAASSYVTNVAGPVVPTGAGAVNVNASSSTYTDGTVANTIKIEVQGTNHAVFVGRGSNVAATTLGVGTNGQLLCGSTGADPAFTTLTSSASTLTYTPGAHTLNIDVTAPLPIAYGGTDATSFSTTNGIVKYDGTRLVTSSTAEIDSSNRMTNTSQPSFLATQSAAVNNVTGDGTVYTIINDNVVYDVGSNYNNATGVFTAPVTGKYLFIMSAWFANVDVAGTQGSIQIQTTARRFVANAVNAANVRNNLSQMVLSMSCIAPMTAGNTAVAQMIITNQAKTVTANGNGEPIMYFEGHLLS